MKAIILLTATCLTTTSFAIPINSHASLNFDDCLTSLVPDGSRMKCGSMQVPMNWSEPSGEQITLGVVKLPARDPTNRIGPLFFNPGGPGSLVSTSLANVLDGSTPIKDEIQDRFDIIGVDVRGTGLSSPIKCDRDLANAHPALYATTPEIFEASSKHNKAVHQSCIDMTGSRLVDFMDTLSQVHDNEAVRQALGDERITWLGQSAGTLLASQYAELYAENIRGMVLDGVVSNSQSPTFMFTVDAASTEATMNYFFSWCAQSDLPACRSLMQNTTAARGLPEIWDDLMLRAARSPLPAARCSSGVLDCSGHQATPDNLRRAAVEMLFVADGSKTVAKALHLAVFDDDASLFLAHGWGPFTVPKDANTYNASYFLALNAIVCQDFAHKAASPTEIAWWQQIAEHDMPHTQGSTPVLWFLYVCIGWPTSGINGPHRISIPNTLSSKALLVSNIYDPSTPTAWGVQVQQEIGLDRAVMIVRNQAGHTVYLETPAYNGSTVAAINRYLLTLAVPKQGTIFEN